MAEEINKKIAIDVQINNEGQKQVDQYKASFDSLRTTIGNLGKPLTDLSKNIQALNSDLEKFAASNEKTADKIAAALKKTSAQQANSNKKLKTSLTEAQTMKEQALVDQLKLQNSYYGELGENEIQQYSLQKKRLDDLLKNKSISQELYNTEAQQLLKGHYDNLLQISNQYLKDGPRLDAVSIMSIDIPQMGDALIKQVQIALPKVKKEAKGFFKPLSDGLKKAFTNVLGYYKKATKSQAKTTADIAKSTENKISDDAIAAAKTTNATVAANDKAAMV